MGFASWYPINKELMEFCASNGIRCHALHSFSREESNISYPDLFALKCLYWSQLINIIWGFD